MSFYVLLYVQKVFTSHDLPGQEYNFRGDEWWCMCLTYLF